MPRKQTARAFHLTGIAALSTLLPLALSAAANAADKPFATAARADQNDSTIGPTYVNAPELTVQPGVPQGTVHEFTMNSTDSKIYPGISKTLPGTVPYTRRASVYIPAGYVPGTAAPFLVTQDSMGRGELPAILDNLIAQKKVPPMVAIMINSGGGDSYGSERGLEYDTVSGKFAEFIESEVLPKVTKDFGVMFTSDPDGRATMGGSSGGAAAFTMAWFHPDLYHRVLTYSGTYVNQETIHSTYSPHGAWQYHENLIADSEKKPLRIWMEVGEHDLRYNDEEKTYHNWVLANQRMAAVLKAKGYDYRYVLALGANHVDGRAVRQTLPDALVWLWQGYKAQ